VTGSTVAFAALHASMLKKGVIAVCRFTRNASAAPRFCYLVPQLEVIDPDTQAQVLINTTGMQSATMHDSTDVLRQPCKHYIHNFE
jgi:Ku70/Ku80 beta-barrel domain